MPANSTPAALAPCPGEQQDPITAGLDLATSGGSQPAGIPKEDAMPIWTTVTELTEEPSRLLPAIKEWQRPLIEKQSEPTWKHPTS